MKTIQLISIAPVSLLFVQIKLFSMTQLTLTAYYFEYFEGSIVRLDFIFINVHLLHTYIHNWSLQPFCQDYDLVSHTTYAGCVNFIYKWLELHFKVDFERQIFETNIYPQRFCQKSAERKSPKKCFHIFVLLSNLRFELGPYV